jgi:hypothetical protein
MMNLADRIERLLQDGKPRITRDFCRELSVDYYNVIAAICLLRKGPTPRIWIVGKWEQLAATLDVPLGNVRKDAGVYSHPGAPMLPSLIMVRGGKKQQKRGSSGVKTPPPYRTGFRWGGIPGMGF